MKEIEISNAYRFFEQGSTLLLFTHDDRKPNVMTFSYHRMLDEGNGLIAVGIGACGYSYRTLMKTKECVLAIPTAGMLETVVKIGNCFGADTDKFKEFDLKTVIAATVKPPLLSEVLINVECTLIEDGAFDKYNAAVL
jgi:flavin reductase (DIM6/NTAB) family NADH-FMN oxidoreductase RutF